MKKVSSSCRIFLACTFGLVLALGAKAQPDTLWIGPASSSSDSEHSTPFSNAVGRVGRTQYEIPGEWLTQFGLSSGAVIEGLCLEVLDDDPTAPPCVMHLTFYGANVWFTSTTFLSPTGPLLADTTLTLQAANFVFRSILISNGNQPYSACD